MGRIKKKIGAVIRIGWERILKRIGAEKNPRSIAPLRIGADSWNPQEQSLCSTLWSARQKTVIILCWHREMSPSVRFFVTASKNVQQNPRIFPLLANSRSKNTGEGMFSFKFVLQALNFHLVRRVNYAVFRSGSRSGYDIGAVTFDPRMGAEQKSCAPGKRTDHILPIRG